MKQENQTGANSRSRRWLWGGVE